MSEFLGNYVDHQMTSPFAMARRSAKVKPISNDLAKSGVLLVASCLRVEVYGHEQALGSIDNMIFSGFSPGRIEGSFNIIQRLAEIASGARSQVLGDNFIGDQLVKAIKPLDKKLPIFQIVRLAIDIGCAARERQRFIASFNYCHVIRDIIADRFLSDEIPDRLYMVGADKLARELIRNGVGERFRSTAIVTRNPKNLRKRLRAWTDIDVAIVRPADIEHVREPRSMVVISGVDVNDGYQAVLQSALLRLEPRIIVDVSQVPVLSRQQLANLDYVTVFDDEFLRAVERNNKQMRLKLPHVLTDIEETLEAAHKYLSAKAP
ncbi:Protein nfe2 [Mesorhizobium sp. ORS 3324]|nr:Protein nfe2 [Mesorhizobium sp. ORS 3324]